LRGCERPFPGCVRAWNRRVNGAGEALRDRLAAVIDCPDLLARVVPHMPRIDDASPPPLRRLALLWVCQVGWIPR